MMALLLAALVQDLKVEVREKSPEVRLLLRGPKEWAADAAMVRQYTLEARDGKLEESWAEVSAELPSSERNATSADVTLSRPGLYKIVLGSGEVRVAVSRSEMKTWKDDVRTLRDAARRLEQVAAEIDRMKDPSPEQIARVRLRLQHERGKIAKLRTELTASRKALDVAVDRLYYSATLSRLPAAPGDETLPGYGAPPKEKDREGQESEILRLARSVQDLITREGAVVIADELKLLLPSGENPSGPLKILNWRDPVRALGTLREAREALGDCPELEDLLRDAQEGRHSDEIVVRLQGLREKLCKP
jgi:hypothetical protein